MRNNAFCPNCGHYKLIAFENNRPVADFYCEKCGEEFELKSGSRTITKRIVNGAYGSMMARLESETNPNLFTLSYSATDLRITTLLATPKYFFRPEIIEPRKPLNPTARRSGWIGCNVLLEKVPDFGKIPAIENGAFREKSHVVTAWKQTLFLSEKPTEKRTWLLDTVECVEAFGNTFSLEEVYGFTEQLQRKHPENKFIQAKLRQQLQILRDANYLEFLGKGIYRKRSMILPVGK